MKPAMRHFAIGLFTLLGLLLLAAACVLFGGSDLFAKKAYFETYFESSVQGLDVGSPVKLRGVQIGAVESIGFAGATYGDRFAADRTNPQSARPLTYVRVLCSIDLNRHPDMDGDRLQGMIDHGLRANLALQGITGQVLVNLDFPRHSGLAVPAQELTVPWTPDNLYVPSTPTTLQTLLNIAQDIAANLGKSDIPEAVAALTDLARDVDRVVDEADIPKLTATFTALGASLNAQSDRLAAILEGIDAKRLGGNLQTLSDNLTHTSAALRTDLPALTQRLDGTLTRADALIAQATDALTELRADVDAPALAADLAQTLSALARTAAATEALVREIRQKPSRILFDAPLED